MNVRLFGILCERANATDQTQEHLLWSVWRSSDLGEFATLDDIHSAVAHVFLGPDGSPMSKRTLQRMLDRNDLHWRVVTLRRRGVCYALTGAAGVARGLVEPLESTGQRYIRDGIDIPVSELVGDLAHRNAVMLLPSLVRGTDDPRSQELIGEQNGMSRRTVSTHVKHLVSNNLLSTVRNELVVAETDDVTEAAKIKSGLFAETGGRGFFLRRCDEGYLVCTTTCNEYGVGVHALIAPTRSVKRVRARMRSIERDQTRCTIQRDHAPGRNGESGFERNDKAKARRTRIAKDEPQKPHSSAVVRIDGVDQLTHVIGCDREHAAWWDAATSEV